MFGGDGLPRVRVFLATPGSHRAGADASCAGTAVGSSGPSSQAARSEIATGLARSSAVPCGSIVPQGSNLDQSLCAVPRFPDVIA